jgi:hypothetical protein
MQTFMEGLPTTTSFNFCSKEHLTWHKERKETRGGALVEALRYKPEGRGFDWNFSLT